MSKLRDKISSLKDKLNNTLNEEEKAKLMHEIAKLEEDLAKDQEEDLKEEGQGIIEAKLNMMQGIDDAQNAIAELFKSGEFYATDEENNKIRNFKLEKGKEGPKEFRSIKVEPKKFREQDFSSKLMEIVARFKALGFVVREVLNNEGASFCGVLFPDGYVGNKNILTMTQDQIQGAMDCLKNEPNKELNNQQEHNIFCFSFRTVKAHLADQSFDLALHAKSSLKKWEDELAKSAKEAREAKNLQGSQQEQGEGQSANI